MNTLALKVPGTPAPQGSKRHVGGGRMIESSKALPAWRHAVTVAAAQAIEERECLPFSGPVRVDIFLNFPALKAHYRANSQELKQDAPRFKSTKPDIDKLARAILDALTNAGVWRDDSQVAALNAYKQFTPKAPFALIVIRNITEYVRPKGTASEH